MDCLTLRRIKLATPQEARPELVAHLRQCKGCAAFVRELQAFEHRLHKAVRVAVPEGLAEQIILRHRESRWNRRDGRRRRWFGRRALAIAASLVLAVSALVGDNALQSSREELAGIFVAHVLSEPGVLHAREDVEPARLEQAFLRHGGKLTGTIGEVRHLGQCPIDGVLADHVLVQTPGGLATLILLPERRANVAKPMIRNGYAVVILPLRGGSLGIVADSPDRTIEIGKLINARVRWQT